MVDHWRRSHGLVYGRRGSDIRRGLIGHDAPVMLLALHGQNEYGGGYGGGYGPFVSHWKEDVPCEVSKPPLPQKWHRWKIHIHWMTFWWWRCLSTKDHSPHQLVRWNQKILPRFDLKKHHCSWSTMDSFDVYVMHGDVISLRTSTQCSTHLWCPSRHLVFRVMSMLRGVSATFEREGLLCTPLL